MSEKADENTANDAGEQSQAKPFEVISSQEELDRIVQERLARERKKFADYEEAKAAQARLAEIEEANKSELEKAQARAEAAEKQLMEKESLLLRSSILAKHAIPEDFQDLVVGDSEESLVASAEKVAALVAGRKFDGLIDPKQGQTPNKPAETDEQTAVRNLFGAK